MSYPYTKPVPRYGFRRRWGDPHTGIVGSGPGRPLRRYRSTNAEVGIPQLGPGLTALGASPETPLTEGIFNVGPAQGFSRGVFTPDPPWATPRYIAATPDGVSGLGAFGQTTPKCGIPQLVDKVIAQFPALSFSLSGMAKAGAVALGLPTSFSIGPSPELIKPIVYSLVGSAGENLSALADQGAGYIAGQLASKVSAPISQKILSSDTRIPASAKPAAAGIISKLVGDVLRNQLYKIGEIIRDCAGVPAATKPGSGCYCQPDGSYCQDDSWCYSKKCLGGKCVAPLANLAFIAEALKMPEIVKFDPNMSQAALHKLAVARLTTIQAELQKCAAAGGEWFPGGAQCDINPITKRLENCRKPSATYTGKRWTCVPKGTPGATSATKAAAAAATGKAPSNLPLILGAAAIAALVLTR